MDPLDSTSRILSPEVVGQEHYEIARAVQKVLQRYTDLALPQYSTEMKASIEDEVKVYEFVLKDDYTKSAMRPYFSVA